jgi:hypothetical protein
MISKIESREFIRQAIAERIGELKDELFHWVSELERLDDSRDPRTGTESEALDSVEGMDAAVTFIGGR